MNVGNCIEASTTMDPRELSISEHTYALPQERIAQQPLAERDASKLLHFDNGSISDHVFRDLPGLLPPNALLVLNDTRVVNARLVFHRATGARIEILCLDPMGERPVERAFADNAESAWHCFIGNAKRWKPEEELVLKDEALELRAIRTGTEEVHFKWSPVERTFAEVLARFGHVPLPPYMDRPDEASDKERYNTVFARHDGSVAAPTASLHFSADLMTRLADKGVLTTHVTLHVGAGTFLPVKSERMADHAMHQEQVRVPLDSLRTLRAQLDRGPIVAVGTTAMRTLESIHWYGSDLLLGKVGTMDVDQWRPYNGAPDHQPHETLDAVIAHLEATGEERLTGRTGLLIAPGYRTRYVQGLITNFHQPQSTLLLLVAAFIGEDWRNVYDHALRHGYRFLSYGDGSLLWRSR